MESDLLGHRQSSIACGWSNGKTLAFQASDRGSIPRLHIFPACSQQHSQQAPLGDPSWLWFWFLYTSGSSTVECGLLQLLGNGVSVITEQGAQYLDGEVDADERPETVDGDSKTSV